MAAGRVNEQPVPGDGPVFGECIVGVESVSGQAIGVVAVALEEVAKEGVVFGADHFTNDLGCGAGDGLLGAAQDLGFVAFDVYLEEIDGVDPFGAQVLVERQYGDIDPVDAVDAGLERGALGEAESLVEMERVRAGLVGESGAVDAHGGEVIRLQVGLEQVSVQGTARRRARWLEG